MMEDTEALVIIDRATGWIECYPLKSKRWEDAHLALIDFFGPGPKPKFLYTDNSGELKRAIKELKTAHGTAIPYQPQSNGVAERAVRKVLEGTRTILLHAGLPPPM